MATESLEARRDSVRRAYATDEKLEVRRRTHDQYTVPRIDFAQWVLDCTAWRGDERVLDLGAGTGGYFAPVRARIPAGQLVAGDLSPGMIRRQQAETASRGVLLVNLDAQALPFPAASFDVVLANHVLYHVADPDAALSEIRRVLKPEGQLLAATYSTHNMPELDTLCRRALLLLTDFTSDAGVLAGAPDNFSLESGQRLLSRHFYAVARYDLPSTLVFPEPEPVLAYLESMRDLQEPLLPEGIAWEDFMGVMREQVTRLIAHTGKMTVHKLSGALVATQEGGFISEYMHLLRAGNPV